MKKKKEKDKKTNQKIQRQLEQTCILSSFNFCFRFHARNYELTLKNT